MKNRRFSDRLGFAWAGLRLAWESERSFRFQVVAAAFLVIVLAALRPPAVWWALCLVMVALVWAAELFNTALESLADRLHPESHPEIQKAKDCAAGAVLVAACGALIVGSLTLLAALGIV